MDAREGGGPGRAVRIPEQAEHREAEPRPAPVEPVEKRWEQDDAERYAVLGED
ncbi:hypothetical protein ACFVSN_36025 [Kitasatospora sp. NPDC057904]|uniref:hypothetical protein n=1 Tax=unclassified Kitasatospora TaxID=2633591 RepID=UPI0036DB1DAF